MWRLELGSETRHAGQAKRSENATDSCSAGVRPWRTTSTMPSVILQRGLDRVVERERSDGPTTSRSTTTAI